MLRKEVKLSVKSDWKPKGCPKIIPIWHGKWTAIKGKEARVQSMVGKSVEGFHPGNKYQYRNRVTIDWGPATNDRELAKAIAEVDESLWINSAEKTPQQRRRDCGLSR